MINEFTNIYIYIYIFTIQKKLFLERFPFDKHFS